MPSMKSALAICRGSVFIVRDDRTNPLMTAQAS
jgi:hypothetical protein